MTVLRAPSINVMHIDPRSTELMIRAATPAQGAHPCPSNVRCGVWGGFVSLIWVLDKGRRLPEMGWAIQVRATARWGTVASFRLPGGWDRDLIGRSTGPAGRIAVRAD